VVTESHDEAKAVSEMFESSRIVPLAFGSVQVRSAVGSVTVSNPSNASAVVPSKMIPVVPIVM
jgi:hypothetical protein